jgi:YD repeat-containing protein
MTFDVGYRVFCECWLTFTDDKYQQTTWRYDEYCRQIEKRDHTNGLMFSYTHDANDRLTDRLTPAKGNTQYRYDAFGNLTNINYPSSPDISFAYDQLNRLTNLKGS